MTFTRLPKRDALGAAVILCASWLYPGCGGGSPPGPGQDGGTRDLGLTDGGRNDAMVDGGVGMDGSVPDGGQGSDGGPGSDMGGGSDGGQGSDMGGGSDGGQTMVDAGPDAQPTGEAPHIVNIAWTVAQDGSCGPSSGILFTVVVTDEDTDAFFLTPTVQGMGSCFFFGSSSATEMVDITLTNCPHDQDYMPTVSLRDPEGNVASVSGFTVSPCTSGAFFP